MKAKVAKNYDEALDAVLEGALVQLAPYIGRNVTRWLKGGGVQAVTLTPADIAQHLIEYLGTYVERDLQKIRDGEDVPQTGLVRDLYNKYGDPHEVMKRADRLNMQGAFDEANQAEVEANALAERRGFKLL